MQFLKRIRKSRPEISEPQLIPTPFATFTPEQQEGEEASLRTRPPTPSTIQENTALIPVVDHTSSGTSLLQTYYDTSLGPNGTPTYRIRLVPHVTPGSLSFNTLSHDLRIGAPPIRIGRFAKNSFETGKVAFPSKVVSRDHAEIWAAGDGIFCIRDTKSSSGTFLNRVRLSAANTTSMPYQIKDGDFLQLGVSYQGGKEEIYQRVQIKVRIEGPISQPSQNEEDLPSTQEEGGKLAIERPATGGSDLFQEETQSVSPQDKIDHLDNDISASTPEIQSEALSSSTFLPLPNQPSHSEEDVAQLLHARVLSSKFSYKNLLEAKGAEAQRILDLLQNLLNSPRVVGDKVRGSILTALLRLSASSGLYPQRLRLHDIEKESAPVTAGQFGEIWRGKYHGRSVCLKIFKLYQRSEIDHLLKRCSREAIVWSQLTHPNLLPFYGIYHLGDAHGRVGLVSPWMGNGNLSEYLKVHPGSRRLPFVHDILAGLRYLHRHQVVHGDLKGVNILITADGSACLADFGLSSVMDADVLRWTSLVTITQIGGTVRWMAPEMIEASEDGLSRPTLESDIYSLASVMFETFTNQVPYHEFPRDLTVLSKVTQGIKPSRPANEVAPELTDPIWKIMIDCWSETPGDRPTIDQVISDFSTQPIHGPRAQPAQIELRSPSSPSGTLTSTDMSFLMSLLSTD